MFVVRCGSNGTHLAEAAAEPVEAGGGWLKTESTYILPRGSPRARNDGR